MGIKKNNPGCNCCNECVRCEGNVVPDSLTLTMTGWPDTFYFYKRCWLSDEYSGACSEPVTIPFGSQAAIERYKITGLSARLNKAFLSENIFGVDGNGYCTITSEIFSEEFSAETEIAFQENAFFPNPAIPCPTNFQLCNSVTVRLEVAFNTYSFTVTFYDASDDSIIYGFAELELFPNEYCEETTGSIETMTPYPRIDRTVSMPQTCVISDIDGCGTFNSFTLNWTLTPGFT
jgi:hypothetical protein